MPSLKEDLIVATVFGAPYVAPFALPYFVAKGELPTLRQVALGIWSGIAWGIASRGGSLFLNYHPEYGSMKHARKFTGKIIQAKVAWEAYEMVQELTNPKRYKEQDSSQSKIILHRGRIRSNPYHPSNMPV